MAGMTCTRCFTPTASEPDTSGMSVEAVIAICQGWLCDDCLNELDLAAIDEGKPPPSGAWGLVERELNDCLADIQEGGSYERHKERIDMLQGLLAERERQP